MLKSVTPFFIVNNLQATIDFYESKLGFAVRYKGGGGDAETEDYWVFLARDQVMLMFKAVAAPPLPNSSRDGYARWDAYVYTNDPDGLYAEYVGRGVAMHAELANTSDRLRAFEVKDNSGYVLCFGRPLGE